MKLAKFAKYVFLVVLAAVTMTAAEASQEKVEKSASDSAPCSPKAASIPPSERRINRMPDGTPIDPLKAFVIRQERQEADKRYLDLQTDAAEMAELSWKISEDIDKGGRNVISAKVFERLDKIEKLVKKVRNSAKE